MRPHRKALVIALAFLVGCGGFAGWSATEFRRQEGARKEIAQRVALLRTEVSATLARATEAEAQAQAAMLAKPAETATAADNPDESAPSESASDAAKAAAERKAELAEYRAGLDETWGLLWAKLHLTPAQRDAFKDLLTQRKADDLALEAEAKAKDLTEESPEIAAKDEAIDRPFKAALKQLLGPQDYAFYRDYHHERAVMPIVMQTAQAIAISDAPMSVDTTLQLMHVLANACERHSNGYADEDTLQWSKAMAAAPAVLTPQQFRVFATIQMQREAEAQLHRQLKALSLAYVGNQSP